MTSPLRLHSPAALPAIGEPPEQLKARQVEKAKKLLTRDLTTAPRWGWSSLDTLVGPMLPSEVTVVAGLFGNGKSSLLMSEMDVLASRKVGVLYFPLEIDPEVCRLQWAAWRCGLDRVKVVRQEWSKLPKDAEQFINLTLDDQKEDPYIHFATPKRMDMATLRRQVQWGVDRCGAKVVVIDHFHRLTFGSDGDGVRYDATEMARELRDIARFFKVHIIAAAQINRSTDVADRYLPPYEWRLKETSALGEEADVLLTISRKLRPGLPKGWERELRMGRREEWTVADPGMMTVMCRKHRLDGDAINHCVHLQVRHGRVQEKQERAE